MAGAKVLPPAVAVTPVGAAKVVAAAAFAVAVVAAETK
jgi:hypothetical protein